MSDMFWEDDTQHQPRESNAMKALREKAEADSKKIAELTEAVNKLTKEVTTSRVEKVVTSKGLSPKVAAIVAAAGVEPTEQAVEAWLKDYGDVFAKAGGQEPAEATGEEQSGEQVVSVEDQVALAAMAAAAQGAEPAKGLAALESQISSAKSEAELLKLLGATV